ncbi:protein DETOXIFICATION 27-like [Vicia villosa]|uniref:protein DETOXIFICATION 27-like n=1 Tax=Vicia villosa TaxID=3911 RepID=UPI00273BF787|nr:protein DETOXIFICATION 27-like [Vicia villosa]XP_058786332.1 protein DETOXIFICATION 27-like [Vicia villosa]XP_058786333.1 protein DETOXIFICATION 27-like [Vicia villosa]
MGNKIPNESEQQNHPLIQSTQSSQPQFQPNTISLFQQTCSESNKLWHIAAPSIFSRLTMFSITVVSQSFAGHLNDLDLAAISIACTLLISITFGFLLGMASALETLCGQAYGAGQNHMLGVYLQRSWVVLFLSSILLLPMFVFATPMLKFIGQPVEVAEQAGLVAIWLIPFHLSFPFQFTLQRFLQCQLKTAIIALVSGGALVIHVILSWVFVYKMRIGIVGIALTIDFSWWVSVLGMLCYTLFGGCSDSWTGFSVEAFVGLWEFFKLSLASGVMLALENFYYRLLLIMSGYMYNSDVAIDALSVCVTVYGWESMIPLGFLAATGVRVANELGAGNAKGAKFATMVSVVNTVLVGFIFWLIIVAFNEKLALIFTSSLSVIQMVHELSFLLAFTILLNCIQPVLSGVAVGSGRQAVVAYINIGSYYLVGIPFGFLLGWLLPSGIVGMWIGMMSGTVVQTLILAIITSRYDWEREVRKAQILVKDDETSNQ